MSLADALEKAASGLPGHADAIRPANGDPTRLLQALDRAGAAEVLRWLLVNEPEAASELADAWIEDGSEFVPILEMCGEGLPKAGRKALRRLHHRLRSRGVELPQPQRDRRVATLPPVEEPLRAGWVTAPDPAGARLVYLVEPNPSGGARLFELVLDERRGILDCQMFSAPRRNVRRFLRELTGRSRFQAHEAPVESVQALVGRVLERQPADRPLPRSFAEWRGHLAAAGDAARTPGELAREALGEVEPAEHQERALEMIRTGEVGPWPPGETELRAAAEKLEEVGRGRIVVSGDQKRERLESALEEVLEELFGEEHGRATAQRFEETAYVLWRGGNDADARTCLGAARLFREASPRTNSLARALAEVLLGPALKDLRDEDEASLLVKP